MNDSGAMNQATPSGARATLAFAALVEIATGIALVIVPAFVIAVLLGENGTGQGLLLARFLGIALVGLGTACWPGERRAGFDSKTFQGMLIYNLLAALLLASVGTVGPTAGPLLWPAVVEHTAVALLLIRSWYTQLRSGP